MFKIDAKEVDSFALPKRNGAANILNLESKKRSQSSKVSKLRETTKVSEDVTEHDEFAFVSTAMGHTNIRTKSSLTNAAPTVSSTATVERARTVNKSNDGKSSDVDEVSVIMAGIQTSDDAINFFARFGSGKCYNIEANLYNSLILLYSPYRNTGQVCSPGSRS